jgi:hypothetical protein
VGVRVPSFGENYILYFPFYEKERFFFSENFQKVLKRESESRRELAGCAVEASATRFSNLVCIRRRKLE